MAEGLGIEIVPIYIHFADEVLKERFEFSFDDFYERMKNIENFPYSSEAKVEDFVNVFKKWLSQGYDILTLVISNRLSKTYADAVRAAELLRKTGKFSIKVYDSLHRHRPHRG